MGKGKNLKDISLQRRNLMQDNCIGKKIRREVEKTKMQKQRKLT